MTTLLDQMNEEAGRMDPASIHRKRIGWSMPPVRVGMAVMWYRHHYKQPGKGFLATVTKVNVANKHISVLVPYDPQGELKEQVFHVEDPMLGMGAGAVEGGCWEYTEETIQQAQMMAKLESRISALEREHTRATPVAALQKDIEDLKAAVKKLTLSK
jgi:polyhydroxyalkanoate synthesis regulator phasin